MFKQDWSDRGQTDECAKGGGFRGEASDGRQVRDAIRCKRAWD